MSSCLTNFQRFDLASLESNFIQLETLFLGGGPATLGTITNYVKTGKMHDMLMGKGFAIVDAGASFGGGNLLRYGIRSNVKAQEFLDFMITLNNTINNSEVLNEDIKGSLLKEESKDDSSC